MIQFYAPDIEIDPILPEADSQHCIRVLRMRQGDELEIVDGKGHRFHCRMLDDHPKRAMVEIIEKIDWPLPWAQEITIAVAPTKNMDRMEWLVEKLVEVGVNRIVPVLCRYSERKDIKVERLRKIAISAMKQSLKAFEPEIWPMTPFSSLLDFDAQQRFVAFCDPSIPRSLFTQQYQPYKSALMLIGPEGDFSNQEIQSALDAGFKPVSLGDNRLRTETAALYACSAMHILDSAAGQ